MAYNDLTKRDKEVIARALASNDNKIRPAHRALKGKYTFADVDTVAKKDLGIIPRPGKSTSDEEDDGAMLNMRFGGMVGMMTMRSKTIRDLDAALESAKVDMETWEVERYIINKWDVVANSTSRQVGSIQIHDLTATELWQVKVWLKRKQHPLIEVALELLEKRIAAHAPKYPTRIKKPTGTHMLEISLFDVHFGKLAWHRETGHDYDLKIAERIYSDAVNQLLAMSSCVSVEKILMPVGQDFFHINSADFLTPKANNPLDTDGRLAKVFEAGYMAVIGAIDKCLAIAPVEVIWVPGNHDPETSLYLCHVLKAWYKKCKDVFVDIRPTSRKYKRYGTCLIGFTHGNEEAQNDLPLIMATEAAEDWAVVRHKEWHIGHIHKRKEMKFLAGDTYNGVTVRTLPSLSGTDAWHYKKGYVKGARAAEAYLWDYDFGYAGHFSANMLDGKVAKIDANRPSRSGG